jgi:hypothetical protein
LVLGAGLVVAALWGGLVVPAFTLGGAFLSCAIRHHWPGRKFVIVPVCRLLALALCLMICFARLL